MNKDMYISDFWKGTIMKVAIVGSRNLKIDDLGKYLPEGTDEIVSGGAIGIDRCAREYALSHNLKLTEFLPDYDSYSRRAPLLRNLDIINYADEVIAFWNGISHGTKFVIDNCKKKNKKITIISC
ncbi:MAG: DUF2493 domain-containing protein [Ruminococcus sp.]|nr:DUF2493 domain-containing protein [Ruminococcus sp.]